MLAYWVCLYTDPMKEDMSYITDRLNAVFIEVARTKHEAKRTAVRDLFHSGGAFSADEANAMLREAEAAGAAETERLNAAAARRSAAFRRDMARRLIQAVTVTVDDTPALSPSQLRSVARDIAQAREEVGRMVARNRQIARNKGLDLDGLEERIATWPTFYGTTTGRINGNSPAASYKPAHGGYPS